MFKTAIASLFSLALLSSAAVANPAWLKEDLNFRYGPGVRYGVIAALPGCTRIHVYEYVDGWYRATWNGITGFVSARYVAGSDDHCYVIQHRPPKRESHRPAHHYSTKKRYTYTYEYSY